MMTKRLLASILFFAVMSVQLSVAAENTAANDLSQRQLQLGERYAQFEQVIQRLAEASVTSHPKNAGLLKKVLDSSKQELLATRLKKIADILQRRQLTDAVTEQESVEKELLELLRILESADREQQRENEKEQLKKQLQELDNITQQERLLKDKTQQTPKESVEQLQPQQEKIRLKTETLKDQLKNSMNSSETDSDASVPVAEAAQKMQQAEESLQKTDKSNAVKKQEDAVAELQKAKAELEKKLRQLREEERIAMLEKLEVRFKRMLQVEESIRSQTQKLSQQIDGEASAVSRSLKIETDRLTLDQQTNITDAEAALLMLREDGTARATAETLQQAHFDMTEIKNRLVKTLVDYVTVQMEDSVIEALKELIDAAQAAKEEAKKKLDGETANEAASATDSGGEPLIQLLSELRMIRTMQRRVNARTALCENEMTKLRQIPNADFSVLQKQVEELARQQNRISRILHDLKVGKSQ